MIRMLAIAIALAAVLVGSASAQDFKKGIDAYNRGDYTAALREFKPLAEQGHAEAQTALGTMFAFGLGVPQDYAEAVRWLRKPAEQGYAEAQHNLGVVYHNGYGVPQDYAEAVRWYRKAAEQGFASAQHNLGLMFADGLGVPKDYMLAYLWWNLAVAQGLEHSKKFFGDLASKLTPQQLAEAQRMSSICAASNYKNCGYQTAATPPASEPKPAPKPTKSGDDKPVLIGAGSGFVISGDGHVLTNQHVVDGCQLVTVHPSSGLKKAKVVATDDTNDLALLQVALDSSEALPLSGSNASLLDDVVVAGYPLSDTLSSTVKVTKGVVSSLAGIGNDYSQIQIDAAIQPGNSGGPILNEMGNVVGVTASALDKEYFRKNEALIPENTNFGIKASTARAFVEANGVSLPRPNSRPMPKREMAEQITKTTHLVGCWVSREQAQKMAADKKRELSVSPTMQRQVEALR